VSAKQCECCVHWVGVFRFAVVIFCAVVFAVDVDVYVSHKSILTTS